MAQDAGITRTVGRRGCGLMALLLLGAVVLLLVVFVLFAIGWGGGGGEPRACRGERVDPARWQAAGYEARVDVVQELQACGRLEGASPAQVRDLLGAPSREGGGVLSYAMPYPDGVDTAFLRVNVRDDRVISATIEQPTGP